MSTRSTLSSRSTAEGASSGLREPTFRATRSTSRARPSDKSYRASAPSNTSGAIRDTVTRSGVVATVLYDEQRVARPRSLVPRLHCLRGPAPDRAACGSPAAGRQGAAVERPHPRTATRPVATDVPTRPGAQTTRRSRSTPATWAASPRPCRRPLSPTGDQTRAEHAGPSHPPQFPTDAPL